MLVLLVPKVPIIPKNSINCKGTNYTQELTVDNVFTLLKNHLQTKFFFSEEIGKEIDFISSNFSQLVENHKDEIKSLQMNILIDILNNNKLQIKDEDQLLKFLIEINEENKKSFLYEFIIFENVSSKMMKEFVNIYDYNFMTKKTWQNLCSRLICDVKNEKKTDRYTMKINEVKKENKLSFSEQNEFKGIINYLRQKSSNKIENEIAISASSLHDNKPDYQPLNFTFFDDQNKYFLSSSNENNYLRFEFKNHRVIPTGYTIKSAASSDIE